MLPVNLGYIGATHWEFEYRWSETVRLGGSGSGLELVCHESESYDDIIINCSAKSAVRASMWQGKKSSSHPDLPVQSGPKTLHIGEALFCVPI